MLYDIIGDTHGHATKLKALFTNLGYSNRNADGVWRHPTRIAVLVGDFVDRGDEQLEVVDIVRPMIEAGAAVACMGNHELNAVAFYMAHPEKPGDHLRTRAGSVGAKNRDQHEAFLDAVVEDSDLHLETIKWCLTLPLWLDLPGPDGGPGIRVVHACWDPQSMTELRGWLAPGNRLTFDRMHDATTPGHWARDAIEIITKGPEFRLPAGHFYFDKGGSKRTKSRLKWWDPTASTVRELSVVPPDEAAALPDTVMGNVYRPEIDGAAPTFFGHYWMSGAPAPVAATMACVDYSAGMGGDLVAYRWNGELTLDAKNFVSSAPAPVVAAAAGRRMTA